MGKKALSEEKIGKPNPGLVDELVLPRKIYIKFLKRLSRALIMY